MFMLTLSPLDLFIFIVVSCIHNNSADSTKGHSLNVYIENFIFFYSLAISQPIGRK